MNPQTDKDRGHPQPVSSIVTGDDGQPAEPAAGMVAIAGVHGVLAPFAYPQEQITREMGAMLSRRRPRRSGGEDPCRHRGAQRNLALELADYPDLDDFGAANDVFIRVGLDLGEQAIRGALDKAGLTAEDIDLVIAPR